MGEGLQEPPSQEAVVGYDVEFFTDAKATGEEAWIGGFLQDKPGNIIEWFSEKLERSWADRLFVKKDLKGIIASLELLATLVAVSLWTGNNIVDLMEFVGSGLVRIIKMMSTKYPLTLLVMELSETLRARSCELNLHWIPREKINWLMIRRMRNLIRSLHIFENVWWGHGVDHSRRDDLQIQGIL